MRLTTVRASVVFSLQAWLSESPEQAKTASQPAYFGVGLSCECRWSTPTIILANVCCCEVMALVVVSLLNEKEPLLQHKLTDI